MTSSQPGSPRPLLLLPGGTGAADVARLQAALSGLLGPTPQPASSLGSSGPLLVPVGPEEDAGLLAQQVRAVLAEVPPAADVLLRTSGSTTGRSSLIAISAAALRASAEATFERLAGPGQWVLALPAHHVAGLQVLVRSALAGTRPVVVDTTGGFRTDALADGIKEALTLAQAAGAARGDAGSGRGAVSPVSDGAERLAHGGEMPARLPAGERAPLPVYVSLVPTQLLRALDDPRATAALARTTAVLVGGAATAPALHARALAVGIPVVRTYGMSETGGGCVYDGVPLDGVEVRIDDPDEDGAGRIVLAGPMLAEAVLAPVVAVGETAAGGTTAGGRQTGQAPGGTADPAGDGAGPGSSRLTRRADGSRELVTSDRGRLDAGVLTVLGRADDVIVTGGIKVEPRIVEEALCRLPGVGQACVVGVADAQWGQAVVAVVVPEPGARPAPERLRRAARGLLDGAHAPKRVVVVDALPQRGPGKVDRRAVVKAVTCHDLRQDAAGA